MSLKLKLISTVFKVLKFIKPEVNSTKSLKRIYLIELLDVMSRLSEGWEWDA